MESVTYTLWCQECGDEVAAYKGETGRNAYSRGVEHLEHLEANDEDKSVLWLHSVHHHQSRRDVKYSMKVTGAFQDPLDRQIMEKVQIQNFTCLTFLVVLFREVVALAQSLASSLQPLLE